MNAAGITARSSKCPLATNRVESIGKVLSNGFMRLLEDNLVKISQAPKNNERNTTFLGLTGYYRQYIPNYASIAATLSNMTKRAQPKKVRSEDPQEAAYSSLKSLLANQPILKLPDHSCPYRNDQVMH